VAVAVPVARVASVAIRPVASLATVPVDPAAILAAVAIGPVAVPVGPGAGLRALAFDVRALTLHLRTLAPDLRAGLALLHPRARFAAMAALRIVAARMIAALRIMGAGAVWPREGRAEWGED